MQALKSVDTLMAALETWRCGTPSRAAQVLSVAPSSVYRAIDRLEVELGTALFTRTSSGWGATPAGLEVRRLAEALEHEVRQTELALLGTQNRFPAAIRISASDSLAHYLAGQLASMAFGDARPAIELIVENQFVDLLKRKADIAIRPDKPPGESLRGQRAGHLAHALYGRDRLFEDGVLPRLDADLARYPFCALTPTLMHFTAARWVRNFSQVHPLNIVLIANSELSIARSIAAGVGIGVLPCFVGDRLESVVRLDPPVKDDADIWIVTHPGLGSNKSITRLIRLLARVFRQDAALFAGRRIG